MMLSRTGWDVTPLPVARQTVEGRRAPWGCAAGAPYRGTASPPPPASMCVCVHVFVCVCLFRLRGVYWWALTMCVCVCVCVRMTWLNPSCSEPRAPVAECVLSVCCLC